MASAVPNGEAFSRPRKTAAASAGSSLSAGEVMMTNSRALTRPWLPEEEARLLSLFSEGATADEVGAQLGRTRQAVYARLLRFRKQQGRVSRTSRKAFAQLSE